MNPTSRHVEAVSRHKDGRRVRLWWSGALAALLSLASWLNLLIVGFTNVHFLHRAMDSAAGWWLYVLARLAGVAVLLLILFGSKRHRGTSAGRAAGDAPSEAVRGFDPLMGLRALACVLVLLGHYFLVIYPFPAAGVPVWVQAMLRSNPWAGVWIFFTLSGFLMGKGFATQRYPLDDSGIRRFLRNRFLRIVPVFYCDVALAGLLTTPAIFHPKNLWMLLSILSFDYRGLFPLPLNPALWSISTEMQFYLLVPVLVLPLLALRRRMGAGFLVIPLLVLLLGRLFRLFLLRYNFGAYYDLGYTPLVSNLDLFVTGLCMGVLPRHRSALRPVLVRYALLAGAVLFSVFISFSAFHAMSWLGYYWATGPLFCALFAGAFILLSESAGRIPLGRDLRGRCLWLVHWTGTLTYCLYVVHPDVLMSRFAFFPHRTSLRSDLLLFPFRMAEVVVAALLMYFLVERPFDRRKQVPGTALLDAP